MNLNGTKKAPPANVVLPHYAFAAISFFVLCVLIFLASSSFLGHYFDPRLLSITHLAALGWISMIIFGALYQLIPVILLAELFSNSLARITFFLFAVSLVLFGFCFWNFYLGWPFILSASLLLLSILFFTVNVYFTGRRSANQEIAADFILAGSCWLLVTAVLGLLMSINLTHPFLSAEHLTYLKLHAHTGFGGWILMIIMGVGSKLIPMFMLSSGGETKDLRIAFYFINSALLGFFTDVLFSHSFNRGIIYFLIALISVIFLMKFIVQTYKKRARKKLDLGLKQTISAIMLLLLPVCIGTLVNIGVYKGTSFHLNLSTAYITSILIGFVSLMIIGQTYKTLPFIVWLHKFGALAGKEKTPLPKDLYNESIANAHFLIFMTAYPIFLSGILLSQLLLLKIGSGLLILVALLYNINVFRIISYPVIKKNHHE